MLLFKRKLTVKDKISYTIYWSNYTTSRLSDISIALLFSLHKIKNVRIFKLQYLLT